MKAGGRSVLDVLRPWRITGPAASPENLYPIHPASVYRNVAPGSQEAPIVPHAEPQNVFDIKYFPRERRRANEAVLQLDAWEVTAIDCSAKYELAESELPPLPGARAELQNIGIKGNPLAKYMLTDDPNNGYTE